MNEILFPCDWTIRGVCGTRKVEKGGTVRHVLIMIRDDSAKKRILGLFVVNVLCVFVQNWVIFKVYHVQALPPAMEITKML